MSNQVVMDEVDGCLFLLDGDDCVFVIGEGLELERHSDLLCGTVSIAYGLYYMYERREICLPTWGHDDFRREYVGWKLLDFLDTQGTTFPRSDVRGQRAFSGETGEYFFKELDLGEGFKAVARLINGEKISPCVIRTVMIPEAEAEGGAVPPWLVKTTEQKIVTVEALAKIEQVLEADGYRLRPSEEAPEDQP